MDLERLSKFKEVFFGTKDQTIEAFFDRFELWCDNQGHDDCYKVQNFVLSRWGSIYLLQEPTSSHKERLSVT